VPGSQYEKVRASNGIVTVFDWPGCRKTFWKPFSCFGGSPVTAGKPT
jgi:hypothetical protein